MSDSLYSPRAIDPNPLVIQEVLNNFDHFGGDDSDSDSLAPSNPTRADIEALYGRQIPLGRTLTYGLAENVISGDVIREIKEASNLPSATLGVIGGVTGAQYLALPTLLDASSDVTASHSWLALIDNATTEFVKSKSTPIEKNDIDRLSLADKIISEWTNAVIDPECIEIANAAKDDALKLVNHEKLGGNPSVMYSDDGILTLQWQREDFGVALIFAGDSEASIAFKKPGQLYAENGIDMNVSDELPEKFNSALASILG